MYFVHYAKAPIVGELVVPWTELPEELRATAGHEGRVHAERFREQWRSDRVYVHELPFGFPPLHLSTGYATRAHWIYEVDPDPPLEADPERNGHLVTSRICPRARVIRCLYSPPERG